jgi:hypothetical protein
MRATSRESGARVREGGGGEQDRKGNNDAIATGVGAVLFWPALFLIKGDAASAQQVAQLTGDMDAIEQANIRKKCGIEFKRAAPSRERAAEPLLSHPFDGGHTIGV